MYQSHDYFNVFVKHENLSCFIYNKKFVFINYSRVFNITKDSGVYVINNFNFVREENHKTDKKLIRSKVSEHIRQLKQTTEADLRDFLNVKCQKLHG